MLFEVETGIERWINSILKKTPVHGTVSKDGGEVCIRDVFTNE